MLLHRPYIGALPERRARACRRQTHFQHLTASATMAGAYDRGLRTSANARGDRHRHHVRALARRRTPAIVEAAVELTGAQYAALGVIDRGGPGSSGSSHRDRHGHARSRSATCRAAAAFSASSSARPGSAAARPVAAPALGRLSPSHPPMKTFLGVPIMLRGVAYGNLYLTEKEGGAEFTDEDTELVTLLAAQAAVAIENARLYESATRWLGQLESLNEVGNAMLSDIELPRLFALIAHRLRELTAARLVTIALPQPDGDLRIETADGEGAAEQLGNPGLGHDSKSAAFSSAATASGSTR